MAVEARKRIEREYEGEFRAVTKHYNRFIQLCVLTDILGNEVKGGSADIIVSPDCGFAKVELYVDDIVFDYGREHPFFEYIKNADFLRFSKSKHDGLKIEYGVNDLWVDAV